MNALYILEKRIQNEIKLNTKYMHEAATKDEVEGMEEETYTYKKVLRMIKDIEKEIAKENNK